MSEPEPPSNPAKALDVSVLRAWIDAARAWLASGGGGDFDAMVDAAIETAVQRWLGVQSGEIRISRYYHRIPAQFRKHFGRKESESLKALIGGIDREGRWQRGLAGLSETECKVYSMRNAGWGYGGIRMELTSPEDLAEAVQDSGDGRLVVDGAKLVSIRAAYQMYWRASRKVRAVLGVPGEVRTGEMAEDWDGEESRPA